MKMPLAGGATTTLASGQDTPQDVMVDAANVYWSTYIKGNNFGFNTVPIGGGTPTTIATVHGPFLIDSGNLYMSGNGLLTRTPIGGGNTVVLAVGSANALAVDATNLYWTTDSRVMKVAK